MYAGHGKGRRWQKVRAISPCDFVIEKEAHNCLPFGAKTEAGLPRREKEAGAHLGLDRPSAHDALSVPTVVPAAAPQRELRLVPGVLANRLR